MDGLLDDRQLLPCQAQHPRHLLGGGCAVEALVQACRRTPPFREQLHHVGRNANRLAGVDERPLDRLLDPVAGIGAEPRAHGRVEAFDGPQESEVPLLDEIGQGQATVRVATCDVDHQSKVGTDHVVPRRGISFADGRGQPPFVLCREERGGVDVAEVGLKWILDGGRGRLARTRGRWHGWSWPSPGRWGVRRNNENDEQPIPVAGLRGSRAGWIDSVVKKAIDARRSALHKQGRKGAAQRLERCHGSCRSCCHAAGNCSGSSSPQSILTSSGVAPMRIGSSDVPMPRET